MNMSTLPQSTAELRWFGNTLISIKIPTSTGDDGLSVIEHWMPHGDAPPLHVHQREDEIFHILEGEMRFNVGGRFMTACKGQTVLAPKGVPHSYRAESAGGVHCLTIMRGHDFETMVRQSSRAAERPELPVAVAPSPETIAMLVRRCTENHIDIVGPPLG